MLFILKIGIVFPQFLKIYIMNTFHRIYIINLYYIFSLNDIVKSIFHMYIKKHLYNQDFHNNFLIINFTKKFFS